MSDKILKLNQAQTLYNDLRERIEALPTDNDIPTKISDLIDDSGHYTKPATGIPASDLSEEIISTIDGKAPAIYCEKSGAIVSFDDGAGNMSLKDCVVQIEPVQEGIGDPSPENVRPITGWTGAKVTRTGKNLFNKEKLIHGRIALTLRYGAYGQDEYNSNTPNRDCFLSAGDYTFSLSGANSTAAETLAVYDETGTRLKLAYNNKIISFTVPVDGYVRITFVIGTQNFVSWDNYDIQLERGSTATTYEPYQGETYDITFPTEAETVYGGTLDVITGVLTVDKAIIDLGTLTYVYRDNLGGGAFSATISTPTSPNFPKVKWAGICSKYKYEGSYSNLNNLNRGIGYVFNIDVMVKDTTITVDDATVMKASLDGVMLCYELATPITYQLTPHEIRTLLGTNNIWADTGDITVSYSADTKTYVDNINPEVPVQDVQVNGTSIITNGVANVPKASSNTFGVMSIDAGGPFVFGTGDNIGRLRINTPTDENVRTGNQNRVLTLHKQHQSVFYGLAKAAGADMKDIANTTVGTYPDAQKEAIQSMLGITQMLAPTNPNLVASQPYSIGDVFAANGHLYKATAAIAQDGAIIPDTNCVETTMAEAGGKIKDVQVAGSSVVGSGVANVPIATYDTPGVIKLSPNGPVAAGSYGLHIENGALLIVSAAENIIKAGTDSFRPITAKRINAATFYGLSKAAGVDLANETVTLGTYPETSKTAIKAMLGVQDGLKVVRLI